MYALSSASALPGLQHMHATLPQVPRAVEKFSANLQNQCQFLSADCADSAERRQEGGAPGEVDPVGVAELVAHEA